MADKKTDVPDDVKTSLDNAHVNAHNDPHQLVEEDVQAEMPPPVDPQTTGVDGAKPGQAPK
jgi:hypothetical protein